MNKERAHVSEAGLGGASGWVGLWVELRGTLVLAVPIMAGFVGQMLMGITDTVMVGRVGTIPLAASAFAHNLYHLPMVAGFGLLSAVGVQVSQAYGAGRRSAAGEALRHGLVVAVGMGLVMGLFIWLTRAHYGWLRQPPEVLAEAQTYLLLVGWSMLPALVSHAIKLFSDSLTRVWPPMFILLGGVLLNIGLNWVLIFGKLGFPALGLAGAGWATLISRGATMVGLGVYLMRSPGMGVWLPACWRVPLRRVNLAELWRLGAPVAAQHLLEVGAFVFAAFMMGWIGAEALAAHQIALTCAATSFMFALGLGMAVSIRVGHAWGAQLRGRLRRVGFTGLGMTGVMMAGFGIFFMVGARVIAGWFTPAREVVGLAAGLLLVAAMFQVFDGLQVVALCALRGMSDVRVPALIAAIAYWGVALPLGYVLGFVMGWGAVGVWVGLAAGLGTAAGVLMWRFWELSREPAGVR
jgi:multidrug resistance protein, MATE family